ncbi:hypothetical protein [Nocardia veterana]|uniref:Uncharacterized protein n=1 Tax=Nocardia veterana TaxID=132249 RepID=A0A7X6RK17_9NOCA|nr:hypothetical protein [Nocardia veterana]NKY88268.1 hypothetical protein [Nocardia veterana]
MIHTHAHPSLLQALRGYARRTLARYSLTDQERRNLAAAHGHPAVYTASLGSHPHL